MKRLEPNDLWLIAQIIECGGLSKAAERLGMPKSTLSRRLAHLEDVLGERLLQRTTRRLTLTDVGSQFLQHARHIVDETDAAMACRDHRQITPRGELKVSMPNDFADFFMVEHLATFLSRYPDVQLTIDLSPRRVDLLAEGFDLAIRTGVLHDDATIAARLLFRHASGLYASPEYGRRYGWPQVPEELSQHRGLQLMASGRDAVDWVLNRQSETWCGTAHVVLTANSPALLVKLACRAQGIVAAPVAYAEPYVKEQTLVRVLPDWQLPSVDVWAVFPGRHLMSTKTRVFIDYLVEHWAVPGHGRRDNQ